MKSSIKVNNRMLMTAPYVIYVSSEHELINIVNGIKLKPEKKLLHLLNVCITHTAESALAARFDKSFVDRLVQANYICPSDQVYKLYNIMLIEIGTTNYCNNRCLYCPMREYPVKEKKVMDMDLF